MCRLKKREKLETTYHVSSLTCLLTAMCNDTHLQHSSTALASISMLYSTSGGGSHTSSTDASIFRSCWKVGVVLGALDVSILGVSERLSCTGDDDAILDDSILADVGVPIRWWSEGLGLVRLHATGDDDCFMWTFSAVVDTAQFIVITLLAVVFMVVSWRFDGENGPELSVLVEFWLDTELLMPCVALTDSSSFTSSSSLLEPKCLSRSSASDVAMSFCDSRACSSWSLTANSFDEGELGGKAWWYDAGSWGCGVLDEGVLVDEIWNHKFTFSSNSTLYGVKQF